MYHSVFKRVEEKYLINDKVKERLLREIKHHIEKDQYFLSTICNVYYDNENQELIINSLEKPVYKDKVRIRSYGIPGLHDDVFLEIKNKYKGIVGKRRIKMKLSEFYDYINNNTYDEENQIMREIDYLFKFYGLKPNMFIAYDRESYCGKNSELRITFDKNLRSRRENLGLEYGDVGEKYLDDELSIMEIKTLGAFPLWLVEVLSKLKIYPCSFSKYGVKYAREIKEREIC